MNNLKNEVVPLFSKPVFLTELIMSDEETKTLIDYYNKQDFYIARDEHETSCEITTNKNVLNDLLWLNKKLEDRFEQFNKEILHYENKIGICNSWFTRTSKNQDTTYHHHANFMWTGSFYFGNDDNYDQYFSLRNFNNRPFYVPSKELNIYNADEWSWKIKNNMVIFFPSEMNHQLVKNKHNTIRKSLAFNMLPLGEINNGEFKVKFYENQ